jgi:arsenate reductase
MAEALSKLYASDVIEAYSAGTETKPEINRDAVEVIGDLYGVDMTKDQKSKLLAEIPPVDIVITMGCNVECPYFQVNIGRTGVWKTQRERTEKNLC